MKTRETLNEGITIAAAEVFADACQYGMPAIRSGLHSAWHKGWHAGWDERTALARSSAKAMEPMLFMLGFALGACLMVAVSIGLK